VEEHTTCHADGLNAATNALRPEPLQASTVEVHDLEAGCKEPDVGEGHASELAAPLGCETYTAQNGGDLVAETFPQVEAGVAELPHAVDGVGTVRLGQDIFELALETKKVNRVFIIEV